MDRADGPDYRKKAGNYIKSQEFLNLSPEKREDILEDFEEALTKPQLRKVKKAIREHDKNAQLYGIKGRNER